MLAAKYQSQYPSDTQSWYVFSLLKWQENNIGDNSAPVKMV
jgi:hypothetical protein